MSVELLSVHIPKTAGTSFRTVLETAYGFDRVHTVYPEDMEVQSGELEDERWLADSLRLCRGRGTGPRVVHGHYLLTWYAERFPSARSIAWLRHPVDRIVSFFYMWRDTGMWAAVSPLQRAVREGRVDLLDFARSPAMRDQMTSRFLGDPTASRLAFIGLQERFEEDLARLGEMLGWPPIGVPRRNVNVMPSYLARHVSDSVRTEIARLNRLDMELYEAVLSGRWQPAG